MRGVAHCDDVLVPDRRRPQLNNVTLYVRAEEFDSTGTFYSKILGESIFEEPGHIVCFDAGPDRSVCVHAADELGRAPGEIEVIYWVEDVDEFRQQLGVDVPYRELRGRAVEVMDPRGRRLRFQERPSDETKGV